MRFDVQYPEAAVGFQSSTGFRKGDTIVECLACGMRSTWFLPEKDRHFCSDECYWRYDVVAKKSRGEAS